MPTEEDEDEYEASSSSGKRRSSGNGSRTSPKRRRLEVRRTVSHCIDSINDLIHIFALIIEAETSVAGRTRPIRCTSRKALHVWYMVRTECFGDNIYPCYSA